MVIAFRRGLDARSIPWVFMPGSATRNSERVIAKIVDLATTTDRLRQPDAIFVDETGLGGPIVDRLRGLFGDSMPVYGVQFGGVSPAAHLADMRTYIYWQCREGLRVGLCIPDDPILEGQLTAPESYHTSNDRLKLESKEDIEERRPEIGSIDRADALCISYAYNVQPREATNANAQSGKAKTDYDPWADRD